MNAMNSDENAADAGVGGDASTAGPAPSIDAVATRHAFLLGDGVSIFRLETGFGLL